MKVVRRAIERAEIKTFGESLNLHLLKSPDDVMNQLTTDRAADGGQASQRGEPAVDLRRQLVAFRKYIWTFLAVVIAIMAVTALVTFSLIPLYTAKSQVVIDARMQTAIDARAGQGPVPKAADPAMVDSEVEVIRSRALAETVVDTLGLQDDPEFNGTESDGVFGIGKKIVDKPLPVRRQTAVSRAMKALKVTRSGLTYVIDIQYTSTDPGKAARIANAFATLYVEQNLDVKARATGNASDVLSTRLSRLRQDVENAEAAVQNYKIQNNLLSASGSSLTEQEISRLNLDVATARTQQAEAEARYSTAKSQMARGGTGEDVGEALSSAVVQNLRSQKATVSRQLADLQTRYGPRHPLVLQTQQQLADLENQIKQEVDRIISGLQANVQISRQRTAAAQGNLSMSRSQLATNNAAEVRLNELDRTAAAARTLYESYLSRYKETTEKRGLDQSDARVLAQAVPPRASSFPNRPLFLSLGLALALSAGAAAVVFRHMLDAGLSTGEQIEQQLGVRFLGSVPLVGKSVAARQEVGRFVVDKPLSAYADALRNLRASIQFCRTGVEVQVVAFTSALPGEGKTSTAIGMCRSAAQSGAPTVLIDCDVRRASSAKALDLQVEKGLVELLRGEATLEEVIVQDPLTSAFFIPIARPRPDAEDLVSSPAMRELLAKLRKRFQMIYLDTAPVLAVADTRVLATIADVTIVLSKWRGTPKKATEAAINQLETVGAYIGGVVLTQVDLREQARSGYGDAGYYYEHYRQYYQE